MCRCSARACSGCVMVYILSLWWVIRTVLPEGGCCSRYAVNASRRDSPPAMYTGSSATAAWVVGMPCCGTTSISTCPGRSAVDCACRMISPVTHVPRLFACTSAHHTCPLADKTFSTTSAPLCSRLTGFPAQPARLVSAARYGACHGHPDWRISNVCCEGVVALRLNDFCFHMTNLPSQQADMTLLFLGTGVHRANERRSAAPSGSR